MSTTPVKWGIIAAGSIAHEFVKGVNEAEGSELYAVSSRDRARAEEFAQKYSIEKAYAGYDAMLADPQVDAVYIATLHPFHLEWIVKSVQAGKHVLCEKPLTMNLREAKLAKKMADENRCLLREAFMYRHHPQTQAITELVESGCVGAVRMISAIFCYHSGAVQLNSRSQGKQLGGGAILDVGCYPMSFSRLIAGRANGRLFSEPIELKAVGHIERQLQTDMWTTATMRFEGDILATATTGVRVQSEYEATIYGDTGRIIWDRPWHGGGGIQVKDNSGKVVEELSPKTSRHLFCYEIESFVREMNGLAIGPREVAMRYEDTLGNMKALDRWRAEIGLSYEADLPRQ